MSISGQLANKEIHNFLRTLTIKISYFAAQSKRSHIRSTASTRVPDNELPYYKHVAGEYILKDPVYANVTNPKTGTIESQIYTNTALILNASGEQKFEIENKLIFDSSVFDEMMYVTSLDTGEEIPFTLRNLHKEFAEDSTQVHEKTLEAYKLPSRYYDLLCERYPNQVDLIKAIVYPFKQARPLTESEIYARDYTGQIPPSLYIRRRDYLNSAANLTIMNYDDSLFEENERFSLISQMKAIVKMFSERWYVPEFTFEEYYALMIWGILINVLNLGLIVQRYSNIKTPLAHDSHIWDYLISKGLETYKGYLNTDQTLFLYKNIDYILRNRGKQEVTNILIDNLFNNVNLDIKAKTIVHDSTKNLDQEDRIVAMNIPTQCEDCTKRSWCKQMIKDYACPDRQAIDNFCKSEPIVLTEEFAGASKEKVINMLVNQYGYSKEEALVKYQRSWLWVDSEVEEIKSRFNRDQLTDLNGNVESLDTVIQREHNCGLEPVYNEDISAQQFNELRHINGTYAPTKLLEIMKRSANPKFARLFNKFLTETFFHLCPTRVNGRRRHKVLDTYTVTVQSDTGASILDFGEMFAVMYLGFTREFCIELLFDHIIPEDKTTFEADKSYFIFKDVRNPEKSPSRFTNANRIRKLEEGVDYDVGDEITSDVYRWAPSIPDLSTTLTTAAGHEFLTNFLEKNTFAFPIPSTAKFTTAFKFGKPVKQQDLINAWYTDKNRYSSYIGYFTGAKKALKIGDIIYGVTDAIEPEDPSIWEPFDIKLSIVGAYKNGSVYPNNGEIPIVPKYFKWWCDHLKPDTPGAGITRVKKYFPDGYLSNIDGILPETTMEPLTETQYYDLGKGQYYQLIELERYIDVNALIDGCVDALDEFTDSTDVGKYITKQFTVLEQLYCMTAASCSVLANDAGLAFLNAVLLKGKTYEVDLTGANKNTDWPKEGVSDYGAAQVKVATYEDWFRENKDLKAVFETVDKSPDAMSVWNTFNTNCMEMMAAGCTLPYLRAAIDDKTISKLRELVTHLSSYKVAFMDVDNTEKAADSLTAIMMAESYKKITDVSYEYIDPILDATWNPRVGGFVSSNGNVHVYTHDLVFKEGKKYYTTSTSVKIHSTSGPDEIDLDSDKLLYTEVKDFTVGDPIPELYKYLEVINLYEVLGIEDRSSAIEISRTKNGVWRYRTGMKYTSDKVVPASVADDEITDPAEQYDEFLDMSHITPTVIAKAKCRKYRKSVEIYDYVWEDYVESPALKYYLELSVKPFMVRTKDTITGPCVVELGDKVFKLEGTIDA